MSATGPRDVIFDLDGTLVDSVSHCAEIMNAMLEARGSARRIGLAEARPHITLGGRRMIVELLAGECGDPDAELADFRARYAVMPTPQASLFPGVAEALAALRAEGFTLSVCSNKPQALCEKVLADLGLAENFAAVVGSTPDAPLKPDTALFQRTLTLTGGTVDRTCYVGDSEVDAEFSARAGSRFVFVDWGYAAADFVCPTPYRAAEMGECVAQIRRAFSAL